jgi:hypothetical protein
MDVKAIYTGRATLEDLQELHEKKGYEFTIEDGKVTEIVGADGIVSHIS